MRKYEVMFIIRPMEEEATNQIIDKFLKLIEKNGGTVDKEDRWGKRQLAYEIKDCTEGYYDLLYVTAEPACMNEADRVFNYRWHSQAHDRSLGRSGSGNGSCG